MYFCSVPSGLPARKCLGVLFEVTGVHTGSLMPTLILAAIQAQRINYNVYTPQASVAAPAPPIICDCMRAAQLMSEARCPALHRATRFIARRHSALVGFTWFRGFNAASSIHQHRQYSRHITHSPSRYCASICKCGFR